MFGYFGLIVYSIVLVITLTCVNSLIALLIIYKGIKYTLMDLLLPYGIAIIFTIILLKVPIPWPFNVVGPRELLIFSIFFCAPNFYKLFFTKPKTDCEDAGRRPEGRD